MATMIVSAPQAWLPRHLNYGNHVSVDRQASAGRHAQLRAVARGLEAGLGEQPDGDDRMEPSVTTVDQHPNLRRLPLLRSGLVPVA